MRTKNQIYDECMSGGITSLLFMNETSAELCRVYVCVCETERKRERPQKYGIRKGLTDLA